MKYRERVPKKRNGEPNPDYGHIASTIDTLRLQNERKAREFESTFSLRKKFLQDTLQREIEGKWDSVITAFKNKPYNDILAKSKALSRLQKDDEDEKDNTTKNIHWFILIAFVLLDCTAIILKVLTKIGPLDYLLEQENIKFYAEHTVFDNVYNNEYQVHYGNFLTMKVGLENEVRLSKEILNKTQEHVQFVMNESQRYQDNISDLINEYRRETDYSRRQELQRLISSLTETFLNSVEKANEKFRDTINSK